VFKGLGLQGSGPFSFWNAEDGSNGLHLIEPVFHMKQVLSAGIGADIAAFSAVKCCGLLRKAMRISCKKHALSASE
jgi:hypothetical protein